MLEPENMNEQGGPEAPADTMPEPGPPDRPSVADAAADLVRMFVDYVRQETEGVVHDKVVLPTQKAGQVVAFALAAAGVLLLGIGYLSAGLLMLLASFIGWTGALFVTGGLLVLGAAGFTYLKVRSMKR